MSNWPRSWAGWRSSLLILSSQDRSGLHQDDRTTDDDTDMGGRPRWRPDDHLYETIRRRWTSHRLARRIADDLDRIPQPLTPIMQPLRAQLVEPTKRRPRHPIPDTRHASTSARPLSSPKDPSSVESEPRRSCRLQTAQPTAVLSYVLLQIAWRRNAYKWCMFFAGQKKQGGLSPVFPPSTLC